MSYEFHALYSTEAAFNCDVTTNGGEQYMGRLYILATEDPVLLKLGIEKEWFLAHNLGGFLISGHINTDGDWSLSPYKTLSPSLAYNTQSEILDRVFSPEYVEEFCQLRNQAVFQSSQLISRNSEIFDEDKNSSDSPVENYDAKSLIELNISATNLQQLRQLVFSSSAEELLSLQETGETSFPNSKTLSIEEEEPVVSAIVSAQTELEIKLQKSELLAIQNLLIDTILENCAEKDTNEFVILPFGIVTVNFAENYFILRSSEDEHTILSATLEADIIDELKEADALNFSQILQIQNIKASTYIENTRPKQLEIMALQNEDAIIHESKGIDYGA
ncbi:hypothetical protein NIES2107_65140 [Nostoc carneum NIES-2107]|nr:hypothetical protein NIES2107_65140 [Nostoc carneum NIES-2107]